MQKSTTKHVLKIFYISLIINVLLTIIKISFGYFFNSKALLSDGINSLTDTFISIGLIITIKLAGKDPDFDHPYGHQKYEGVTFLLLGIFIGLTGIFIGVEGFIQIINNQINQPDAITIIAASVALLLKLIVIMINYYGYKKYKSVTLKADSLNHSMDFLMTFVVLISLVLFNVWSINIENYVTVIISLFIFKTGFDLVKEGLGYLVDEIPSEALFDNIKQSILAIEGVLQVDDLKMRKHVNYIYVDVEIGVCEDLNLKEAHLISENVHDYVEKTYPEVLHVMVHVNPIKEQQMIYYQMHNGLKIPAIGMGSNTFGKENNDFYGKINNRTKELKMSYDNGYRLVDTANLYRNEDVVGKSIIESKLKRTSLFITSKISTKNQNFDKMEEIKQQIDASIKSLGGYIDLYLIHHPSDNDELNLILWKILINYYNMGKFKAIGVSNFNERQLNYLIQFSEIKPMLNQIESNPKNWNHEIIKFCLNNDIVPQAWGPLDPVPNKDVLTKIGKKYNKTWAQVLIRYQVQRGVSVIPKSHNNERQKENINVFDFSLDENDIYAIEK